jgi:hypothetical protein
MLGNLWLPKPRQKTIHIPAMSVCLYTRLSGDLKLYFKGGTNPRVLLDVSPGGT